jgi:putative ubiquitin-RnfH superfamily antitoxin RatB of RatAB toxin-antitoxin module
METVIIVKIAPLGEVVREVSITSGTTVEEALRIANVSLNGRSITLNDEDANIGTPITETDSVVALITKMKGGA